MSDLFNSNKANKTRLENIFGEHKKERDFLPPDFQLQKAVWSSHELEKLAIAHKVRILRPRAIRIGQEFETGAFLPPRLLVEGTPFTRKVTLPYGDKEMLPSYKPTYFALPYDRHLVKQLLYELSISESDSSTELIKIVVDKCREEVFTNGSMEGQMSRLGRMNEIRFDPTGKLLPKNSIDIIRMLYDKSFGFEDAARVLSKYLPMNRPEDIPGETWPGLFGKPSSFLTPGGETPNFPSINMNSISGMPYATATKGTTITGALVLADTFMNEISTIIKDLAQVNSQVSQTAGRAELKKLLSEFWYLNTGILFPKAERYNRKETKAKTRNIFAAPFPTHIIASLISTMPFRHVENASTMDTPSLYAFSAFNGGLHAILEKVIDTPDESTSFVYADNWYIAWWNNSTQSHDWYSLDLEKAEAQVTQLDGCLLAYMLLRNGHTTRTGQPAFNSTWAYVATRLIPTFFIDAPCLLGNLHIKFPGQGSGNTWTFLLNHIKTSVLDLFWRARGMPKPDLTRGSDFEMKVLLPTGVKLKIELETLDLENKLESMANACSKDGYFGNGTSIAPTKIATVPLDLLGWDATYSHSLQRYIPILNSGRLASSIAMAKRDTSRDFRDKPYSEMIYNVARLEALRLVGGWAYDVIDETLGRRAEETRSKLLRRFGEVLLDNEWEDAIANTEFGTLQEILKVDISTPLTASKLIDMHAGSPLENRSEATVKAMAFWRDSTPSWDKIRKINDFVDTPGFNIAPPRELKAASLSQILVSTIFLKGLETKRAQLRTVVADTPEYYKIQKEFNTMASVASAGMTDIYIFMTDSDRPNIPASLPTRMVSGASNPLVVLHMPFKKESEGPALMEPGVTLNKTAYMNNIEATVTTKKVDARRTEFENLSKSARKRRRAANQAKQ